MFGKIINVDYAALSPKVSILTDKYKIELRGQEENSYSSRYNIYGARFSTDSYRNQPLEGMTFLSETEFGNHVFQNKDENNEVEITTLEMKDIDFIFDKPDYVKKIKIEPFDGEDIVAKFEITCKEVTYLIPGISQILKFVQYRDAPLTFIIRDMSSF